MALIGRILHLLNRIPGEEIDELRHYDSKVSRHIVVNYKGFYYRVECFDAKNQILSPTSLQSHFDRIITEVESKLAKVESPSNEGDENSNGNSLFISKYVVLPINHYI